MTVACYMNLFNFPMDQQECELYMESCMLSVIHVP